MKKKSIKLIIILTLVFISIFSIYILAFNSDKKVLNTKEVEIFALTDRHIEIINSFELFKQKNGMYSTIVGLENTYSDYYTFYANLLLDSLDVSTNKQLINELNKKIEDKNFMKFNQEDVLKGIEKLYYIHKLMKLFNKEETSNFDIQQFKKYLSDEISFTYNEEGFFFAKELNEYKNDTKFLDVQIGHTLQTLELADEYGMLNEINIASVTKWLLASVEKSYSTNSFSRISYVHKLLEIIDAKSYINKIQFPDNKTLPRKIEGLYDIMEIEGFISLYMDNVLETNELVLDQIYSKIVKSLNYSIDDPQILYRKITCLNMLGKSSGIGDDYRNKIIFLLKRNEYKNGLYPIVTKYYSDFKQTYLSVASLMQLQSINKTDKSSIKVLLNGINIAELYNKDIYEAYCAVQLDKILELNVIGKHEKKIIEGKLLNLSINILDSNSIMQWKLKINFLNAVNHTFSLNDLPTNTKDILKKIKSNTSYFKEGTLFDLIFINTLYKTGLLRRDIEKCTSYIKNINTNVENESASYYIYYRYILLNNLKYDFDIDELKNYMKQLECMGGYLMSSKKSFYDIIATFYLIQLDAILCNGGRLEYEL